MTLKACDIVTIFREARKTNASYINLSPDTISEICRLLENKSRVMTLQEVQDWIRARESQRDPIFILNMGSGSFFWLHDDADIDDLNFCHWIMNGTYTAWTGRPTVEQMEEVRKIG